MITLESRYEIEQYWNGYANEMTKRLTWIDYFAQLENPELEKYLASTLFEIRDVITDLGFVFGNCSANFMRRMTTDGFYRIFVVEFPRPSLELDPIAKLGIAESMISLVIRGSNQFNRDIRSPNTAEFIHQAGAAIIQYYDSLSISERNSTMAAAYDYTFKTESY